jgi:chromosome segregation ATPase
MKRLEELSGPVSVARTKQNDLVEKFKGISDESKKLQEQIVQVSEQLSLARQNQEQLVGREKKLDAEIAQEFPKLEKASKELNALIAEQTGLEKERDTLENQIKKLQALCDTLQQQPEALS